jgi:hypothetical protein
LSKSERHPPKASWFSDSGEEDVAKSRRSRGEDRRRAQLGELAPQLRVVEGYYDLDTAKVKRTASQSDLVLASLVRLWSDRPIDAGMRISAGQTSWPEKQFPGLRQEK